MILETISLARREIQRNALRSSLTILGIVIGVAAVITLVTLGGGATAQVTEQIASLGSNLIHVRPGQGFRGPGGTRTAADPFSIKDVEAIVREIPGVEAAAPIASQGTQAISGNLNWSTMVTGTDNAFFAVKDWELAAGRIFSASEIKTGSAVCILGNSVKKALFGNQDALGASIRLKKLSCQVIGVLEVKGQSSFGSDQDDLVLIPLRMFQRRIAGNTDVSSIYVSASDSALTQKVQTAIERLMRERRRIGPDDEDDFHAFDMKEVMTTLTGTTRILTALLTAVAAVSLLVGGIGIMNIMLVSVTERTREIGIRLAVGARGKDVLLQFLIEAVVLSVFGGIVGILLGLGAAVAGSRIMNIPFFPNIEIIVIAVLFSGAVGVVFGYFPARKAARLDPIDALRHE
jgi:putative ABC transport system permease protein